MTARGIALLIGAAAMLIGALGIASSATAAGSVATFAAANGVDPAKNKASYWVDYYTQQGNEDVKCVKYEPVDTPFILGDPPAGRTWLAIIVKAGAGSDANWVTEDPAPGPYSHPSGKDNSHVIVCSIPKKHTTTSTTSTTTTSTTSSATTSTTTSATSSTTTHTSSSTTGTTPPPTTSTVPPTGPVVETDLPARGSSAPWLLSGGLLAMVAGIGLTGFGLRRRGTQH